MRNNHELIRYAVNKRTMEINELLARLDGATLTTSPALCDRIQALSEKLMRWVHRRELLDKKTS